MIIDATLELLLYYKYYLLIPLGIIEGPIVSVLSGFLIKLDLMNFLPVYILLMIGDILGDIFWYGIGYWFGKRFIKRFGKFFGITDEKVIIVERVFHKHKDPILFVSKVTMGLGFAIVTLVVAGMVKIPFRRYLALNILGQLIWTAILLMIGFIFGEFYSSVDGVFGTISFYALIVAMILMLFGFSRYIRMKVTKELT